MCFIEMRVTWPTVRCSVLIADRGDRAAVLRCSPCDPTQTTTGQLLFPRLLALLLAGKLAMGGPVAAVTICEWSFIHWQF